jgi:aspartyl protease family protein
MSISFFHSRTVIRFVLCFALVPISHDLHAFEVGIVGLFPGKAVLVVDGGTPRTIEIGAKTQEGVKLIAVEGSEAVLEIGGKRQRIGIGEQVYSVGGSGNGPTVISLTADANGHFMTSGSINGSGARFMVDTGATMVAMGAGDARRANIDYAKGESGTMLTANGPVRVWRVSINALRIGDVLLNGVDGVVQERDMPFVLLGMSFLNRMEMQRSGETMTLRRRF